MKPLSTIIEENSHPIGFLNTNNPPKLNGMATEFHICEFKLQKEGFIKEYYYDKDEPDRRINNMRVEMYTYSITSDLAIEVVYGYKMLEGVWVLRNSSIELTSEGTNTALALTTLEELLQLRTLLTPKG